VTEELELLSTLAGKGGENKSGSRKRSKFEASIIATFNSYLPFYEDVVLRRLVASGCHHNVLLMDRGDLIQSFSNPTSRPSLAGRAYTLVPMQASGAFHPKVALLVGKRSARIFVGSHNITLSGFGGNRELSTLVDLPKGSEDPHAPLAQAVWAHFEAWLDHQSNHVPQSILQAALRVATGFAPWLKEETAQSGDVRFIGSVPEGESLWQLVRPLLPKKAKHVSVIGPFFDRGAKFLGTITRELQPASMAVGVEPDNVEFSRPKSLPEGIRIVDAGQIGRGTGYLHAKALWVEGEDGEAALITGSANPSSPAWTEAESKRNAEAVLVHLGKSARTVADILGITSIPSMPELGTEAIQKMAERVAHVDRNIEKPGSTTLIAAECQEGGIFLYCPGVVAEEIKEILSLDQTGDNWKEVKTIDLHSHGLFARMTQDEAAATRFLEVNLLDGRRLQAFVHHPASIAKLSRTSKQQRFRDALDSLESESPDVPTVIRLAGNLIFDDDKSEIKTKSIHGKRKRDLPSEDDKPLDTLSVSIEETKQHSRRHRQLRGDDLGYIIETLIYRLGIDLRSAVEILEETGPTEEERIGTEDDDFEKVVNDSPKVDIAKVCQRKIRTLVGRMLKHLMKYKAEEVPPHRPAEQLLAVLAVLREVRAQDRRLKHITDGHSLVPLEERRRLLDGAISALFANKQDLCQKVISAFEDDPEGDFPRFIGLLLWLVWDCSLDARTVMEDKTSSEDYHDCAHELAGLVQLFLLGDRYNSAIKEAERSIWRTLGDVEQNYASTWLKAHCAWGRSLRKLYQNPLDWPPMKRESKIGDLALPVKDILPTLQVVKKTSDKNVYFAEPGDTTREQAYLKDFVSFTEMPPVPEV
jgi:hypothetical protein